MLEFSFSWQITQKLINEEKGKKINNKEYITTHWNKVLIIRR